uniref:Delta 9/14 acylCoA acetylenase n=1 Tax=Chauliognathus lugubris TaxID=1184608 RepID=K7PCS1_9COLE|nr:delta 9/14 acylCoA acetylenase [Chauliognathus lugubris]
MPPNTECNIQDVTGVLEETDREVEERDIKEVHKTNKFPELPIIWFNVFLHAVSHSIGLYGLYVLFTSAKWWSVALFLVNYEFATLGTTAGIHRLWSHRSYKARWPLTLFLTYCQTLAFQYSIIYWATYHRVHHKYTETDADPHNAKRGFFHSHMGWTIRERSPEFISRAKEADMSDLYNNTIVRIQDEYYYSILIVVFFIMPTVMPMYLWNETFVNAFSLNILRYLVNLHRFFFVNSAAHKMGYKPYRKDIYASDFMLASILMQGDAWHNYHHTFPWDYKTSEHGTYGTNVTTGFIDLMAKIGWAYDLKTASPEMIKRRVLKSGDGSHHLWGWGDKDQSKQERSEAIILNKKDN